MYELNENEQEVLRILWQKDRLKPAEIQTEFGWEIENATLRSVLRNLVDKEFVSREKAGKAFVYRPRRRRDSQFSKAMKRMAEIFAGGSRAALIMELLKREELSPDELATLREIAEKKHNREDNQ
jgi:BlaI family transcriptional regulator, penicillinase repressor